MKRNRTWLPYIAFVCLSSHVAQAECVISEEAKKLDAVEVGFCESEGAIETIGGLTDETGKERHFRMQRSTLRVVDAYKGKLPEKATLIANLYDKKGAYVFAYGKKYLIFAKKLAGESEYAGASAVCSVQPTLPIEEAEQALRRLLQHQKGVKPINCANISAKQ
jgi:hypothetical protein